MIKNITMKKKALLSVSDKTGIVDLASFLVSKNFEIISTGGTAKLLKENNIYVTEVSNYTGSPEILAGRVKTLHPKIFAGVLALRDDEKHLQELNEQKISNIDLVVVNLYPFAETLEKENVKTEEIIENIDIGGPSLLRAAAKNFRFVSSVCDPNDYQKIMTEIEDKEKLSVEFNLELAAKAFIMVTQYDSLISNFLYPSFSAIFLEKKQELRYGENPHQKASFYKDPYNNYKNITNAIKHQGKDLSYNNIVDADLAFAVVKEFTEAAVAIIKHAIPCGVAIDIDVVKAYKKAYAADIKSPFGGVVAMNKTCDEEMAQVLVELFLELVIAPKFTEKALAVFKKKKNLRVLEMGGIDFEPNELTFKKVSGGLLVQDINRKDLQEEDLKIVSKKAVSAEEKADMKFAWKVIKYVKSNAIVLVKNGTTVGIGAGQTARVDAVGIACKKAGDAAKGAVLASDAFFPFSDGIEVAASYGVSAVIHPGGSIRDKEVEQKVDELGLGMIYCGQRAFLH